MLTTVVTRTRSIEAGFRRNAREAPGHALDSGPAATAEVVRRQDDGTWKYVIDNPDAAGVLG